MLNIFVQELCFREMIVCHKHRFIFLKSTKTAGTSIEIALSRYCDKNDIVTPFGNPDDEILRREYGGQRPVNYAAPWREYCAADWLRVLRDREKKARYYNHITAHEVHQLLPSEIWNDYFKFSFTRNPWDRVLSHLHWVRYRRNAPTMTLAAYFAADEHKILMRRGHALYTIAGEPAVDRICRYENLQEELDAVTTHLGLSAIDSLPRAKAAQRQDRRPYREVFAAAERDMVAELFKEDIERFGYEF